MVLKSLNRKLLNEKEFEADQNAFFNFGFAEGVQSFEIYDDGMLLDTIDIEILPRQISTIDIIVGADMMLGDVNQDGIVNVIDIVQAVNTILDDTIELTDEELCAMDLNGEGINPVSEFNSR